jgi:hypothetical protein
LDVIGADPTNRLMQLVDSFVRPQTTDPAVRVSDDFAEDVCGLKPLSSSAVECQELPSSNRTSKIPNSTETELDFIPFAWPLACLSESPNVSIKRDAPGFMSVAISCFSKIGGWLPVIKRIKTPTVINLIVFISTCENR